MSLKRSGLNPLSYMGVEPSQPAQFIPFFRDPTPNDINFNIGTVWLNRKTETPWMLVNLDKGIATWIMFGSSTGDVVELMGNSGTASGPIVTVTTGTGNAQGTALFTGDGVHTLTETFSDANNNTGLGTSSLADLSGGSNNTALGVLSGTSVTSGSGNVFVGVNSGLGLTTGTLNTLIGDQSYLHLTSGDSNIGLGVNAGSNYTTTESSNILLNNIGILGESNTLRVGLSTGTGNKQLSNTYISGIQGVNVGSVASVVSISGDHLGTTTLTPGTGITITPVANTIVIAATGGGGGGSGESIIGTNSIPSTVGSVKWVSPYGGSIGTQAALELISPTAGTISNLYVNVTSNASTSNDTVTLNLNGVNTPLVATITAGTVAVFDDLIHSVSVAQGDEIQFELSASTTGIWQGIISADFTTSGSPVDAATSFITSPATGTAIPVSGVITLAGTGGTTVTAGAGGLITINSTGSGSAGPQILGGSFITGSLNPAWAGIICSGLGTAVQTDVEIPTPIPGTLSNFYADISTNTGPGATITVNKNGSPTAITVTVPAATTGRFTDLTHSFSVVAGDTLQFEVNGNSSGNFSAAVGIEFNPSGGSSSSTSVLGTSPIPSVVGSTVWATPYASSVFATQSLAEFIVPQSGTISNLYVNVVSNASTSNNTVTINKNGVNTSIVVTITASTVAVFSDLIHSASFSAGDTIQFELSASTTGTWSGIISVQFTS